MSAQMVGIEDDVIDKLVGLQSGGSTHALRHQREKVVIATQGSYRTLFDPALAGIGLDERLLVALYACRLSGAGDLAAHYRQQLEALSVDAQQLAAATEGQPEQLPAWRLRAMLIFTRALTQRPVEGDKEALHALPGAGISTAAVVALSQLIAFISYQVRVVAGLKAMEMLVKQSSGKEQA
ncbi:CMD domain-containing protein [Collimonas silvisoli]|uniref:CMD domain-containing protein n=1 Tax=Collimonas silvisoli TaxID=2825884 RepID=UPI001B8CA659|nr:CMD domain protein [Collimonas silvisoli]